MGSKVGVSRDKRVRGGWVKNLENCSCNSCYKYKNQIYE